MIADDFSSLTFPIDHIDSALLETAVQQKLSQVGLILTDLPKLLPFFLRGGWPLDQARQAGAVSVSLRLSEPEEDADVWLLETVLSTATTKTTGHLLFVNIPYLLKKHYLQSGECLRLKLSGTTANCRTSIHRYDQ